jgi:hypothetical protein
MGTFIMLVLDGHGSHLTPEFDRTCTDNKILPVCMPPRSSHLLQPLDVGCFAVLKRYYRQLVEQRMRLGFNHIDKIDFLTAFPQARTMAYKAQTIQNSFTDSGLVPFNPDRVIQQRNIQLKTPTPLQVDQAIHNHPAHKPLKIYANLHASQLQLKDV